VCPPALGKSLHFWRLGTISIIETLVSFWRLGIDPAGYKVLDVQSKVAYVARSVMVFDGKFLSTEENQIHGLSREEEPTHSNSLDPTPTRLEDSRD